MILEFKLDKKSPYENKFADDFTQMAFLREPGDFLVLLGASLFFKINILYSLVLLGLIILVSLTLILNNALAPKNSSFFLPRTYSFTDDGVTVKFSNSERKGEVEHICRLEANGKLLCFIFS